MVKITKIYTRTGDDGTTGLVGGARVPKNSTKVHAYGEVDELNSWLGLVRTTLIAQGAVPGTVGATKIDAIEHLSTIQNLLFDIGAVLAAPPDITWPTKRIISENDIVVIEGWIDCLTAQVPELRSFVLPGGTIANSYLHITRTVCRRAERAVLTLHEEEPVPLGILQYLNRLSDYLFALARYEIIHAGSTEFLWSPGEDTPARQS